MSQKNAKKKRKLQESVTEVLKVRTYKIALDLCKDLGKDFKDLDGLERLRICETAKRLAIRDLNAVIDHNIKELGK